LNSQSLDALLLTTEVDIRYFTGFLSQFFSEPDPPLVPHCAEDWQAGSGNSGY